MRARRLWIALSAFTLAVGIAGCGNKEAHPNVADANNIGGYVDAGPITYQLQISRILNAYSSEDSAYVKGLPAGTAQPTANQYWYGVFLWAKNQTEHVHLTTDRFIVVDTQGNIYRPINLNPALNPFAWTSRLLRPLQTEPAPDTPAFWGPTQGGLVLFKINTSAVNNRPLTLFILSPSGTKLATISLDL